jgi:hypothetical protein
MPKIFVFTVGDRAARRHLADSIEHPIPDETVFANFAEAHHEELERVREEGGGFYAWGALPGPGNPRTWKAMHRDDRVLCVYDNTYHYAARVLAKHDNPDLARTVWGKGVSSTEEPREGVTVAELKARRTEISPEEERRVRKLVCEGMAEEWALREVLASDHPLDCECGLCL